MNGIIARYITVSLFGLSALPVLANAKTPIQTTTVAAASPTATPTPLTEPVTAAASAPSAPEVTAPAKPFAIKQPNFSLQPFVQLQAWAVHSIDRQAQLDSNTSTPSRSISD